jgi:plastocyanin
MPRARLILAPLVIVLTAAVAACTGASSPGWTFEPPPSVTPAPSASAGPSGSAVPSSSAGASASAGASESAGASQPVGATVKLAAQNIQYDQTTLAAPANTAFVIEFTNNDAGVPHNVSIKDQAGMEMFKGDIFNGVDTKRYQVPALPAGTYTFFCAVHPNMTGTLTVQ